MPYPEGVNLSAANGPYSPGPNVSDAWEAVHYDLCRLADRIETVAGKALANAGEDISTRYDRLNMESLLADTLPHLAALKVALANLERMV